MVEYKEPDSIVPVNLPAVKYAGSYFNLREWNFDHLSVYSEFIYINDDSLTTHIHKRKYEGKKGDILLIREGTLHRDIIKSGSGILLIEFIWPELDRFMGYFSQTPCLHILADQVPDEVHAILLDRRPESDIEIIENLEPVEQIIANSKMLLSLMLIFRRLQKLRLTVGKSLETRHYEAKLANIVIESKKFIEQNYARKIGLKDVAEYVGVSTFYLSRVFSEMNDFSLFEYLNQVRMQKALEMLKEGNMFISDIAVAVGFSNSNYFTKAFKRSFGKSPSKYVF